MTNTVNRWVRKAPGYYTSDLGFEINGFYVSAEDAGGYGAGMRWIVTEPNGYALDPFDTLRDAKAAVAEMAS